MKDVKEINKKATSVIFVPTPRRFKLFLKMTRFSSKKKMISAGRKELSRSAAR